VLRFTDTTQFAGAHSAPTHSPFGQGSSSIVKLTLLLRIAEIGAAIWENGVLECEFVNIIAARVVFDVGNFSRSVEAVDVAPNHQLAQARLPYARREIQRRDIVHVRDFTHAFGQGDAADARRVCVSVNRRLARFAPSRFEQRLSLADCIAMIVVGIVKCGGATKRRRMVCGIKTFGRKGSRPRTQFDLIDVSKTFRRRHDNNPWAAP